MKIARWLNLCLGRHRPTTRHVLVMQSPIGRMVKVQPENSESLPIRALLLQVNRFCGSVD